MHRYMIYTKYIYSTHNTHKSHRIIHYTLYITLYTIRPLLTFMISGYLSPKALIPCSASKHTNTHRKVVDTSDMPRKKMEYI